MEKALQSDPADASNRLSAAGLVVGPVVALLLLLIGAPADLTQPDTTLPDAWVVLALLLLMAIWWVTEAVPIPVTSLLPIVVLPLFGISSIAEVSAPYMHPIVVLLMGGFIFAKAIERWDLHERIALNVVKRSAGSPTAIIGGFMFAAALLSMWISNSATAIMMMPIALSVAGAIENDRADTNKRHFTCALLLGIAYACSIGGLGTPIGTPTNLIVMGYLSDQSSTEIGFAQWMMLGVPVIVLLVPLAWFTLTRWAFNVPTTGGDQALAHVAKRLEGIGRMTKPEWRTLILFTVIAAMWMFRRPLNHLEFPWGETVITPLSGLTDHMTAIFAVILCFVLPAGGATRKNERLLNWSVAEQIPWGVLLLFGGGMSLAHAISSTGLSAYIGNSLSVFADYPLPLVIFLITAMVLALTEVTSNIATASALMPVVGAIAIETGLPIELMAAPLALAASCAFMLPMATGPNAVAFATKQFSLATMAKTGFRLNIIAVFVILAVSYYLAPIALG